MKPTDINRITEEEIIRAIQQVGDDSEIIEALKSTSEQELQAILQRERDKKPKKKTIRLWLYSVTSAAAVVLILLLLNIFRNDLSQNLYTAYFDVPAYQQGASRGTSEISDTFFDLYNKGQYKEALNTIKPVSEVDLADDLLLKFYASISYMKINEIPKAIKYLSELHETHPEWQEVQWYLALSYLKAKQTDKAKELLQTIDDEKYAGKAKELLGKMK